MLRGSRLKFTGHGLHVKHPLIARLALRWAWSLPSFERVKRTRCHSQAGPCSFSGPLRPAQETSLFKLGVGVGEEPACVDLEVSFWEELAGTHGGAVLQSSSKRDWSWVLRG